MDDIDCLKKEIKKLEIIIAEKDKTIRSLNRKSEENEANFEYIEQLNKVMKINEELTEKIREKELFIEKIFKSPHKLVHIPSCITCEKNAAESDEILKQVTRILKNKNDLINTLNKKIDHLKNIIEENSVEIDILKINNQNKVTYHVSFDLSHINFEILQVVKQSIIYRERMMHYYLIKKKH